MVRAENPDIQGLRLVFDDVSQALDVLTVRFGAQG
jgi:hypothetical protein